MMRKRITKKEGIYDYWPRKWHLESFGNKLPRKKKKEAKKRSLAFYNLNIANV